MKEAFRLSIYNPDDSMLEIRYEADGEKYLVQVPEEVDPDGDVFNDLWIEQGDDMDAAGYGWDEDDSRDEARAVWHGEGPEPDFWIVMRLRPAETMPDWMERTP